jgi:hypothetical protein
MHSRRFYDQQISPTQGTEWRAANVSERRKLLAASKRLEIAYGWHQITGTALAWYLAELEDVFTRSATAVRVAMRSAESAAYAWSDGP